MNRRQFQDILRSKRDEIGKIENEIRDIERQYALDCLSRSGYSIGQRIDYNGKEYEIVGASVFVFPCPDGRLVLKSGKLGNDVRQLYNIRLFEDK